MLDPPYNGPLDGQHVHNLSSEELEEGTPKAAPALNTLFGPSDADAQGLAPPLFGPATAEREDIGAGAVPPEMDTQQLKAKMELQPEVPPDAAPPVAPAPHTTRPHPADKEQMDPQNEHLQSMISHLSSPHHSFLHLPAVDNLKTQSSASSVIDTAAPVPSTLPSDAGTEHRRLAIMRHSSLKDAVHIPRLFSHHGSHPASALAEGWHSETATSPPPATVEPVHDIGMAHRIERAFSGVHDALTDYADRDAEEGAEYEYRLADAREALPDDVQMTRARDDEEDVEIGPRRPSSFRPSVSRRFSRTSADVKAEEDKYLVTFETTNTQHENPRNWSKCKKYVNMAIFALFSLMGPYASSMVAPAGTAINKKMHFASKLEQNLMVGVYMLAFVFGPLMSAPVSESVGRRKVVLFCHAIFIVFNIGSAVSNTKAQMIVLRFFTGLFSGAMIPMGGGVISDMFEVHERGLAMSMYTIAPVLGPTLGPLVSGWIIVGWGEDKWRWVFWISTILAGFIWILGFLFAFESYAPTLLRKKARKLRESTGEQAYHSLFDTQIETITQKVKRILLRPFIFMFTELPVGLPTLYVAIIYGCFYMCVVSVPDAFGKVYHYNEGISSLQNIGLGLGEVLCGQAGGYFVDFSYAYLCKKYNKRLPEYKIPLLMITVFFMPLGLLLYGWTVEYHKVWIAPDIGLFLVGGSVIGSILQVQMYMVDLMTIYASSALSATISSRGLFSFTFLLYSDTMFRNLGYGWAMSLMALICAVIGIPAPFLLWKYGPMLRAHSKYCVKG